MNGIKVLLLASLWILVVLAEEDGNASQKLVLQKSQPYDRKSVEEPSLLQRIKNWIYPGSDAVPDNKAVAGHNIPQYIPPPRYLNNPKRPDCDPCNKEPWIPIATNYGQNTVIGFVKPAEIHGGGGLPPLSISQDLKVPPPTFQSSQQNIPNQNYGPPVQLNQNHATSTQNFVLNPPPVSNQYGPPPPAQNYGPPRPPNYGPPPQASYGPPPNQNPPPPNHQAPLNQNYGSPNQNFVPPKPNYGPPKLGPPKYGPPRPSYGPPRPPNFVRPPPPKHQYNPPRFVAKPRPPHQNYGVPFQTPIGMKPPPLNGFVTNYGVPPTSQLPFGQFGLPFGQFGLPSAIPSDSYGAPIVGDNADYALSAHTTNLALDPTPTIPLESFDDILTVPNGPIPLPNLNQYPMAPLHGAQDFHGDVYRESDSQESRNVNQIANGQGGDVQIVKSIPLTTYVSSVDYPITLIQSPLVDVTLSPGQEDERHDNRNHDQINHDQRNHDQINHDQRQHDQRNYDQRNHGQTNYGNTPMKLSDHPIIVDSNYDNFASGSNQNESFTNHKDVVPSYSQEVTEILPNPNTINQLVESRDLNTEKPGYTQPPVGYTHPAVDYTQPPVDYTQPPVDYKSKTVDYTGKTLDYTTWTPSASQHISTSMVPPTPGPSTWLVNTGKGEEVATTPQAPKQYQIIIPYTTKQTLKGRKVPPYSKYDAKLSLYTQPPTTESEWMKYTDFYDSQKITTEKPNLKDLLNKEKQPSYDVLSFQKNIDDWTAQEYSNSKQEYLKQTTVSQISQNQHSKEIPRDFFITKAYNFTKSTTPKYFVDHEAAGSQQNENKLTTVDDFESNFIITDGTDVPSTTTDESTTTDVPEATEATEGFTASSWDSKNEITSSKEKIYVVTPEPLIGTTTSSTIAFSLPPKVGGKQVKTAKQVKDDYNNNLRLILSDWPHLINNLETTTSEKSTSAHPLFGLMDLSSYIPPENSTIQTYSGHSKVITIVTPVSVQRNRSLESTTSSSTTGKS